MRTQLVDEDGTQSTVADHAGGAPQRVVDVPLRAPAGTSAVMSVPDRFWCWTARVAEHVLNCFAGSPAALARLGDWPARVAALRPDLALDLAAAVRTGWDDDPWAQGGYSPTSEPRTSPRLVVSPMSVTSMLSLLA